MGIKVFSMVPFTLSFPCALPSSRPFPPSCARGVGRRRRRTRRRWLRVPKLSRASVSSPAAAATTAFAGDPIAASLADVLAEPCGDFKSPGSSATASERALIGPGILLRMSSPADASSGESRGILQGFRMSVQSAWAGRYRPSLSVCRRSFSSVTSQPAHSPRPASRASRSRRRKSSSLEYGNRV